MHFRSYHCNQILKSHLFLLSNNFLRIRLKVCRLCTTRFNAATTVHRQLPTCYRRIIYHEVASEEKGGEGVVIEIIYLASSIHFLSWHDCNNELSSNYSSYELISLHIVVDSFRRIYEASCFAYQRSRALNTNMIHICRGKRGSQSFSTYILNIPAHWPPYLHR